MQGDADRFVVELPAVDSEVSKALNACRRFFRARGVKRTDEVAIVLRELLRNAVIHGSGNAQDKRVRACITLEPCNEAIIEVSDQGLGFDHNALDLALPEDGVPSGGRGLKLVAALCAELEFSQGGSLVRARIPVTPDEGTLEDGCCGGASGGKLNAAPGR